MKEGKGERENVFSLVPTSHCCVSCYLWFVLILPDIYNQIKAIKGSDWTQQFAKIVYDNVAKHKYFITNLGKCTQIDARPLSDGV